MTPDSQGLSPRARGGLALPQAGLPPPLAPRAPLLWSPPQSVLKTLPYVVRIWTAPPHLLSGQDAFFWVRLALPKGHWREICQESWSHLSVWNSLK